MGFVKNEEMSEDLSQIVSKLKMKIEIDDKCVAQDSIYEEQSRFYPRDGMKSKKMLYTSLLFVIQRECYF